MESGFSAGRAAVLGKNGQHNKGQAMFKEFRDFAIKGNMIDLAVGVIIGAAFGAIVSSIVDDIFMPLIGIIIGGIDFSGIVLTVGEAKVNIGLFINAVVKFTIIAFVLFMVVKGINRLKRQAAAEPVETTPAPSREEVLLTEIRDALRATPR
jgi:large conductance mechanosensitive channel